MKIMLVVENPETVEVLETHLHPRGFEFIKYMNPIKAMDNIDEAEPDIVLFSAEDFPRHWKPFINLLREEKPKEETVFILLVGEDFPFEEAAKAVHLQVNGILNEDFRDTRKMMHLEGLLSRYKMIKDNRREPRYMPFSYDEIEFIFTHPVNMKLITGVVFDISPTGINFTPDSLHLVNDLEPGDEIPHCSLRIGDEILGVTGKVVRNARNLVLEFPGISTEVSGIISEYIADRAERELRQLSKQSGYPAEKT
ncbi:MAG: PilZ domain-containing protein [Spirochaetia bacterium]